MSLVQALGSRPSGARFERMKSSAVWSPTHDGFVNPSGLGPGIDAAKDKDLFQEFFCGGKKRRPGGTLPMVDPRKLFERSAKPETGLRVTWLGHSTVLVEIDGYRVLTDPVWGPRSSPVSFAGPARFHPPPLAIADLPPLDAIVISHDHYDHLDFPTVKELAKLEVPFVTSLGVGAHLEGWGIPAGRIHELDWWESTTVPGTGLRFTAAPSQHFSGRSPFDRNQTLWSSFAISAHRHQIFFSGDTGLTDEYRLIRERLGRFDLTMIEIGAFHPAWGSIHLGPENALRAHALLGGGALLPLHWGTFDLAVHLWDEPAETLVARADQATRDEVTLVMPRLGGSMEPARAREQPLDAWWREVPRGADASTPEPADLEGSLVNDR